jgi:hypothetical protein
MDSSKIADEFGLSSIQVRSSSDNGGPWVDFIGPGDLTHSHQFPTNTGWDAVYDHMREYVDGSSNNNNNNRCKSIW